MKRELLVKYEIPEVQDRCPLFHRKTGDAGLDLCNATGKQIIIPRGCSCSVYTGVAVKIPTGCVGFLNARSSTFYQKGLLLVNGVIDSGYTGSLHAILWHPGMGGRSEELVVNPWDRIAQLIVVPFVDFSGYVLPVDELPKTERGTTGFGSTGG